MAHDRSTAGTEKLHNSPTHNSPVGAVVIGGDHPGLAAARSLARRGIPVCVIDDQHCISSWSRYVDRVVRVESILDEQKTVDAILEVGKKYNLRGWVLFPTRDETVAAFSRHRERLSEFFRVTTGEWESVQWAWDKNKTYELAESLGIPCPKTYNPQSRDELPALFSQLPLAIKPAIKENFFYATGAKAWRANTPEELLALYDKAASMIRAEEILIQEIVIGGGLEQFSYCAFVKNGKPHSVLSARRLRQRPYEFARAATYVETVDAPEIEELSERFLKAINYHGIVEIEFKRDARDGKYKLLDVNARAWGFHAIGRGCGVDFPYIAYADQLGIPIEPARARPGMGWLRVITDIPTALTDLVLRRLTLREYIRSIFATRVEAVFDWKDPVPTMAEIVFLPYFIVKKLIPSKPGNLAA
jgi:predicted ATP-grasp superfamily ATP-dependent carboligase